MGLGIVKTSWTTVILPPYSSSIILGYLIYRKTFTHSDFLKEHGCEASVDEFGKFVKSQSEGEIEDGEAAAVAGGWWWW